MKNKNEIISYDIELKDNVYTLKFNPRLDSCVITDCSFDSNSWSAEIEAVLYYSNNPESNSCLVNPNLFCVKELSIKMSFPLPKDFQCIDCNFEYNEEGSLVVTSKKCSDSKTVVMERWRDKVNWYVENSDIENISEHTKWLMADACEKVFCYLTDRTYGMDCSIDSLLVSDYIEFHFGVLSSVVSNVAMTTNEEVSVFDVIRDYKSYKFGDAFERYKKLVPETFGIKPTYITNVRALLMNYGEDIFDMTVGDFLSFVHDDKYGVFSGISGVVGNDLRFTEYIISLFYLRCISKYNKAHSCLMRYQNILDSSDIDEMMEQAVHDNSCVMHGNDLINEYKPLDAKTVSNLISRIYSKDKK